MLLEQPGPLAPLVEAQAHRRLLHRLSQFRGDQRQQVLDPLAGQRRDRRRPRQPRRRLAQRLAFALRQRVDLVPDLDDPRLVRLADAELRQDVAHVLGLDRALGMGDVAHVQDQVGVDHLLQRGAERRHQLGRQIGDESHRVRQHHPPPRRDLDRPHRRVERGEQHVPGQDPCPGQPVEQRRLARVGVAHQRHHRDVRPLARRPMLAAGAHRLGQRLADALDPLVQRPPVRLDLGLAGAAEKAETAPLALQMGPGPHEARFLIGQMRQLDLQHALARARPVAEDLQDQPGAVQHLGLPGSFQVALLDRRQRAVDDDEADLGLLHQLGDLLDLARAEQRPGAHPRHRGEPRLDKIEVERPREAFRLRQGVARIARRPGAGEDWMQDHRPHPHV